MRFDEFNPLTENINLPWTIRSAGEGDFYVQRNGKNAGQPHKNRRSSSEFAITVDQSQLVPEYFWYVILHLYQNGAFKPYIDGTIGSIRKRDFNKVVIDFFKSQQVKESNLTESPAALAIPMFGMASRELISKYGPRVLGALIGSMLSTSDKENEEPELTPEEQDLLDELEKELEGQTTSDGDSYNKGGKYTDDIRKDQEKARKQLEKDGVINPTYPVDADPNAEYYPGHKDFPEIYKDHLDKNFPMPGSHKKTNESVYHDIESDLKYVDASVLRYVEHSDIDDDFYDNMDRYIKRELDLYFTAITRNEPLSGSEWDHVIRIKPSLIALLEVLEKKGLSHEWIDNHWMNISN